MQHYTLFPWNTYKSGNVRSSINGRGLLFMEMSSERLRQKMRRWVTVWSAMVSWRTCSDVLVVVWSLSSSRALPDSERSQSLRAPGCHLCPFPSYSSLTEDWGLRFRKQLWFLASYLHRRMGWFFKPGADFLHAGLESSPLRPCVLLSFL